MVKIFVWLVFQLPPNLAWLAPWLSLVLTALFWMAVAFFLRMVLFALLRWITRRTETDIDDVIMDVTDPPLFAVVRPGKWDSAGRRVRCINPALMLH